MRAVCLCAATLSIPFICAEPATLNSLAASANVLTVESTAFDAAQAALEKAVSVVDPVAVETAIKQLEEVGARIPVLPYLQILGNFVSQKHFGKRAVGGLCGVLAAACWTVAGMSLLGRGGVEGHLRAIIDRDDEWQMTGWREETARVTGPNSGSKSVSTYGFLSWREMLPFACSCGAAGAACAGLGWWLARDKFDEVRARRIIARLLSSKALVLDEDDDKTAAVLRPLGIIFTRAVQADGAKLKNQES